MKAMIFLSFVLSLFALAACGTFDGKDDQEDQGSSDAVAVNPVGGPIGPKGDDGAPGATGPGGPQGPAGAAIVLFDANGDKVGYKFNDSDLADVFLPDGTRALFDMDTGELRAPLFNFFCMFESADCTGACLVYDKRWKNVLVMDAGAEVKLAPRAAVDLGPKTMESFVHDDGSCRQQTIGTLESYEAQSTTSSVAGLPLAAPLYWDLEI